MTLLRRFAIVALMTVALAVAAGTASSLGVTPSGTATPQDKYSLESISLGEDSQTAWDRLEQDSDEPGIRLEKIPGLCVAEVEEARKAGREPRAGLTCPRELRLVGRDYDLTLHLTQDYPNHPDHMCVSSIQYAPHGFSVRPEDDASQSKPKAFLDVTDEALQPAQYKDPSPLSEQATRYYYEAGQTCHRENGCFTPLDQCLIAPKCLQVVVAQQPLDSGYPATYITIFAGPYIKQQAGYAAAAESDALDQRIHVYDAPATPIPAASQRTCDIDAILASPIINAEIGSLTSDYKLAPPPSPNPWGTDVIACDELVCLVQLHNLTAVSEVVGLLKSTGGWREIWHVWGPPSYADSHSSELDHLRQMLKYKVGNDGWSNASPSPASPLAY